MSFRDERDAQRERIEQLERALATAERERDEARAELARDDEARDAERVASTPFQVGAKVYVEWRGRWWRASVREVVAPGRWLVSYDGWARSWDETVGPERIVAQDATPPGPLAQEADGSATLLFVGLLFVALLVGAWLAIAR